MAKKFKYAVLFDVDGTLIDSTYFHTLAWWQAFAQSGHLVAMSKVHRAIGMGGDELVRHLLGSELPDGHAEKLKQAHGAIFSTHWPALVPFRGAKDLLMQCADAGIAVVLASSAQQKELDVLRKVLDAEAAISAATSSSDADAGKPAPDIVDAALNAVGVDADRAIFVGDAVWDAAAAAKLGLPMVGVCSGGTSAAELHEAGASAVYEDAQALLDGLAASPLGQLIARARQS